MSKKLTKKFAFSDVFEDLDMRILDAMPDWVRVIDNLGDIVYANNSMIKDIGFNPIGLNCFPDKDGIIKDKIPSVVSNHHLDFADVLKEEREIDGRIFSIKSSPLYDKDKKIFGKVEVFRDITSEKRTKIDLINSNKKMFDDILFASKIQKRTLPCQGEYGGIKVNHRYISSEVLSGDTFDIIEYDEDNVIIYIADIVGHGVTASILTMFVKQTMRCITQGHTINPSYVLKQLTKRFGELDLDDSKYFTIFYGVYNRNTKEFVYANAGHNAIPIKYNDNGYDFVDGTGFPISYIFIDSVYKEEKIKLNTGDKILFYTDGITETKDYHGKEFGEERLLEMIKHNPEDILDKIIARVKKYGWGEQKDDIALLLVEVL